MIRNISSFEFVSCNGNMYCLGPNCLWGRQTCEKLIGSAFRTVSCPSFPSYFRLFCLVPTDIPPWWSPQVPRPDPHRLPSTRSPSVTSDLIRPVNELATIQDNMATQTNIQMPRSNMITRLDAMDKRFDTIEKLLLKVCTGRSESPA